MNQQPVNHGCFITLEGIEGVGKTTLIKNLNSILPKLTKATICFTREPGGTVIAEQIRNILVSSTLDENLTAETELLLIFAARKQHVEYKIKPALARGEWVISDRFTDGSYAYQGAGRGIDREKIAFLESWLQGDLRPHLTLLLDAPVELALQRAKQRNRMPDRFEMEQAFFFERARQTYLDRAKEFPSRYRIIDATQPLDDVTDQLKVILNNFINE